MQVPFVTTVSFADRDGMTIKLQYGVAAPSENEARSELQRHRTDRRTETVAQTDDGFMDTAVFAFHFAHIHRVI